MHEFESLKAEEQFKDCWSKLVILRDGGGDQKQLLQAIISFQPALAKALYRIESVYQKLCKEGREMVAKERSLHAEGLSAKTAYYQWIQHLLKQTSDVGKALGDGFAWLFYQNERELVRRHLEQEAQSPPANRRRRLR